MSKENNFKNWLTKVLRDRGAMVQPIETSVGPGVPDLVVVLEGTTYWIEVKALTGSVWIRPSQQIWHKKLDEAWGSVLIINENPESGVISIHFYDASGRKNSKGFLVQEPSSFDIYTTRESFKKRFQF